MTGAAGPSGSEAELMQLRDRLLALVDASSALLGSLSLDAVLDSILTLSERMVDADAYAVWRSEPATGAWRIVTAQGVSQEFRETSIAGRSYPGQELPEAPLVVEDPEASEFLKHRRDAYAREGIRSLLSVPLRFRGAEVGTITFYFRRRHHFAETELHAARALANLAASAIGTAELYARQNRMRLEAEAAERSSAFLAEAGAILASSLDYETTLASVARLAVPRVADWCVVDVLESDGRLRQLAVAHVDPSKVAWARELQRRYPADPEASRGAYNVVRTSEPTLVSEISDTMLAEAAQDVEHLEILRQVGFSSYMCVPLLARGRTLGAISFISAESGRHFAEVDLALAMDLGRRAAMAVDNAVLYETAHRERSAAQGALAALRASETRFQRLADSGVIGIITGEAEQIRDANDSFLKMVGFTREDVSAGRLRWTEMTPPEWARHDQRSLDELEERWACTPYEKEYIRKDGTRVPILVGTAMLERNPFRWIAYVVDLRERKRLEERLRESQKLESIGLLAGGIAHDFNNLLTGVMGNASLALDDLDPRSPARNAIANVMHASERAADLTRQLLAYSGRGRFVIQPVDLSDMVRKIAGLLHTTIPKKVRLELDLARSLSLVDADAGQIQQLLMNLVINAAEAIGNRPGTVRVSTATVYIAGGHVPSALIQDELAPGEYVRLEVCDTGSGMEEETKARIFDPFYTTKFTGRGLGLAAVLGIVRSHHGDIRVESAPGRGSVFRILLPVSAASAPAVSDTTDHVSLRGAGTVLVVDDEEVVRQTARAALERYGYRVLDARDGAEGIRVFQENLEEVSLVLLDVTMPVMGGEEALRVLNESRPELRVIVSSGFSESEAQQRFDGAGVGAFIQKPYTAAQLAEKVRAVMRRSASGSAA